MPRQVAGGRRTAAPDVAAIAPSRGRAGRGRSRARAGAAAPSRGAPVARPRAARAEAVDGHDDDVALIARRRPRARRRTVATTTSGTHRERRARAGGEREQPSARLGAPRAAPRPGGRRRHEQHAGSRTRYGAGRPASRAGRSCACDRRCDRAALEDEERPEPAPRKIASDRARATAMTPASGNHSRTRTAQNTLAELAQVGRRWSQRVDVALELEPPSSDEHGAAEPHRLGWRETGSSPSPRYFQTRASRARARARQRTRPAAVAGVRARAASGAARETSSPA